MIFLILLLIFFLALMWLGNRFNQADWGHWSTNILDGLLRLYCRKFHRQDESQIELPENTPLLLAANHISGIDPFLLITATRRPIRFMIAVEEYQNPWLNWMFRAAGCIPVDRSGRVEKAFRSALRAIKAGELVAVFPQGGIHRHDFKRETIKPGIIRLSQLSGCGVLPVRIEGVGAPGEVAKSVIKRSHIQLVSHPLVTAEEVALPEFRTGMAEWLLGRKESIF